MIDINLSGLLIMYISHRIKMYYGKKVLRFEYIYRRRRLVNIHHGLIRKKKLKEPSAFAHLVPLPIVNQRSAAGHPAHRSIFQLQL